MDSITLALQGELPPSLEEVDAHAVYADFEKITDGRCKQGRRYPVARCLDGTLGCPGSDPSGAAVPGASGSESAAYETNPAA